MKKNMMWVAILIFWACSSSKNTADKWVGETKREIIKTWGPPVRVLDNDKEGEILVYADQIYTDTDSEGSRIAGPIYWNYNYMYVNKDGKIFSYRTEKQNYPPQALDSYKLSTMNLLTSK